MKTRVGLMLFLLLSASMSMRAAAADAPRSWNFAVSLGDKPIGHHRFTVEKTGDQWRATSSARFDVKFLYMTVYRYAHDNQELWNGDCLAQLEAVTNDDGTQRSVLAERTGDGMVVQRDASRERAPDCVMSFAYWNPKILDANQLLNPQTGELTSVRITEHGIETLRVGELGVEARRYRIAADPIAIDVWYTTGGDWVALQSTTESGRILRYTRVQ